MVAPRGHDGAGTGARRPCGDHIAAGDAVADRLGDALMSHSLASVCDLCSGPPRGGGPQDQRTRPSACATSQRVEAWFSNATDDTWACAIWVIWRSDSTYRAPANIAGTSRAIKNR